MAQLSDYINVTVSLGTSVIDTAGFGTPMFLGTLNYFSAGEEYRIYSDTTAMVEDGVPVNHPAYIWAQDVFGQTQRPNTIVLGKQDYTSYDATPTPADTTDFTVKVGVKGFAKEFTFTSGASATAAQIVDGLVALIVADTDYTGKVTPTNVGDVLIVTPATGTEAFVTAVTTNIAVAIAGAEDVDVALAAVAAQTVDWFFMAGQSQAEADILKFAAFAESNDKMYFASVPVSTVGAVGDTDIASQLKALQYKNTQTITRFDANLTEYASGAVLSSMASTNPGTSVWFGKTLVGVTAENFSGTQEALIRGKNSNYYPLVAGVGFYTDGRQANGNFGDDIRFSLWLKARIAEAVFGLMKRKSDLGLKIPHDEDGYAMVRQAIENDVIAVGVARGAISTSEQGAANPVVRTPARSEIPTNDRASRILPDVVVDLVYSGAVQDVRVKVFLAI